VCRWLPADHPFRTDPTFGPLDNRGPPEARNHTECVAQGTASDNYQGFQKYHVKHDTGINCSCPLSFLHQFDIVWDICPDMMHIIKNFFEKLTFKLFTGMRTPEWDKSKNKMPAKGDADYKRKYARHQDAKARWKTAVQQNLLCTFSDEDQKLVDQRVKNLVGPSKWIKNSMVRAHMTVRVRLKQYFDASIVPVRYHSRRSQGHGSRIQLIG
jgi:hypothetical protein